MIAEEKIEEIRDLLENAPLDFISARNPIRSNNGCNRK